MKTLESKRSLPSPTNLLYISGPGVVANDYNAPKSIHAPLGQDWKLDDFSIRRTAKQRTLLCLDASHAIPTRVLRFGPSRRSQPPPVRPVHPTGQTNSSVRPVRSTGQTGLVLLSTRRASGLGFQAQPRNLQWFCGESLVKPRRRRLDLHAKLQATSLSLLPHGQPTQPCLVP